jgi:ArsR family transcriptional regulator
MSDYYEDNARIFKAFCDESRLRILELLQTGEKCACVLLERLPIGQSTLSHHMKILMDSGVVKGRKDGKWMHYSLYPEGCETARLKMEDLLVLKSSEDDCSCEGS